MHGSSGDRSEDAKAYQSVAVDIGATISEANEQVIKDFF
jgi:hypothetical protein